MTDADTERTEVRVRLPAYQKAEWVSDADDLGMSQSEFVRTMVQAGRHDLNLDADESGGEAAETEHGSEGEDPGGGGLEDRVLGVLRQRGAMSWDDLLEAVAGDLEDRLDEAMADLQDDGTVRYSGRDGGYVVTDE
ncbi:DUF5805 domain-containing protein [Halobaculum sp. D14]|uniref:DUF5805 domain-containing protein n=1 Tax=unclassified Halobaculum TaxID=2640896 RepID=UPI003EBCB791